MGTDATNPEYFLRDNSGARNARRLSGRGTVTPGYTIIGTGKSAASEGLQNTRIVKVVSPLTGQSSAAPGGGWRYANRNDSVRNVNRVRVQRSVSASQFGTGKVVRPARTALRRMTGSGQGVVGYT